MAAAELGGMLLGGGMMLASAIYASSFDEKKLDFANQSEAVELYNQLYDEAMKKPEDKVVLASKFGDPVANLRYALTSLGFKVSNDGEDEFITLDLRPLIRNSPSFESERKLTIVLFKAGLIMSPGEANGHDEPGFFRINCRPFTDSEVAVIKTKMLNILKTFKCGNDKRAREKATNGHDDDASAVAKTTEETSSSTTTASSSAATTEKKKRRVAE